MGARQRVERDTVEPERVAAPLQEWRAGADAAGGADGRYRPPF